MIVDFYVILTGDRHHERNYPQGTYSPNTYLALSITADFLLSYYRPQAIISGMALGWDAVVAECAINRGVELIAAVPFKDQENRWILFSHALEAFRTAISYRFVEWLNENRHVFAAYKASCGFIWA